MTNGGRNVIKYGVLLVAFCTTFITIGFNWHRVIALEDKDKERAEEVKELHADCEDNKESTIQLFEKVEHIAKTQDTVVAEQKVMSKAQTELKVQSQMILTEIQALNRKVQ